jgi:hypothetical protein
MKNATELSYVKSLKLSGDGDCALLGALPDLNEIYLELYDAAHMEVEQIGITFEGDVFARGEEETPLEPPPNLIRPRSAWTTMALNFAGARHRGLRTEARIDEMAHPMSIEEKMAISKHLKLDLPAPMILGCIESYALAEATLSRGVYCVCRRLRIAYALPTVRHDDDGDAYNYESVPLYLTHVFNALDHEETPLHKLLSALPEAPLYRPMDCMTAGNHLLVADGGSADHPPQLHLWALPPNEDDELKKIYG